MTISKSRREAINLARYYRDRVVSLIRQKRQQEKQIHTHEITLEAFLAGAKLAGGMGYPDKLIVLFKAAVAADLASVDDAHKFMTAYWDGRDSIRRLPLRMSRAAVKAQIRALQDTLLRE